MQDYQNAERIITFRGSCLWTLHVPNPDIRDLTEAFQIIKPPTVRRSEFINRRTNDEHKNGDR